MNRIFYQSLLGLAGVSFLLSSFQLVIALVANGDKYF